MWTRPPYIFLGHLAVVVATHRDKKRPIQWWITGPFTCWSVPVEESEYVDVCHQYSRLSWEIHLGKACYGIACHYWNVTWIRTRRCCFTNNFSVLELTISRAMEVESFQMHHSRLLDSLCYCFTDRFPFLIYRRYFFLSCSISSAYSFPIFCIVTLHHKASLF